MSIRSRIVLNNRKLLNGIAEIIGEREKIGVITVAIDKLDKTGIENVNRELEAKGLSANAIEKLQPILFLEGSVESKLSELEDMFAGTEEGMEGVKEMRILFDYLAGDVLNSDCAFDLTLARGLDYYTGIIIEAKALDMEIGSICGGGRYDDLTGIFGLTGVSGVGISFGADRIYDVMNQLDMFPGHSEQDTQVLFINFGHEEEKYCIPLLNNLRNAGIASELFPSALKIKRQMAYANSRSIPWVIIAGEDEIRGEKITVKDMISGEQHIINKDKILDFLRKKK